MHLKDEDPKNTHRHIDAQQTPETLEWDIGYDSWGHTVQLGCYIMEITNLTRAQVECIEACLANLLCSKNDDQLAAETRSDPAGDSGGPRGT